MEREKDLCLNFGGLFRLCTNSGCTTWPSVTVFSTLLLKAPNTQPRTIKHHNMGHNMARPPLILQEQPVGLGSQCRRRRAVGLQVQVWGQGGWVGSRQKHGLLTKKKRLGGTSARLKPKGLQRTGCCEPRNSPDSRGMSKRKWCVRKQTLSGPNASSNA